MRIRAFSLSALLVVTLAWPAHASTFTLSPDLPGLTFTIENLGLASEDLYAADGVDDTYAILFGLETTTAYADAGALADLFAAFALDFGDSAVEGAALVSSPSAYSWSLKSNEKVPGNSAKCNGSETGGVCVEEAASATGNLVLDANATYSWLFHVDLGTGGFGDATVLTAAIGTLKKTGPSYQFHGTRVVSGSAGTLTPPSGPGDQKETGTGTGTGSGTSSVEAQAVPVPEPASLALLGAGLLLGTYRLRRRRS